MILQRICSNNRGIRLLIGDRKFIFIALFIFIRLFGSQGVGAQSDRRLDFQTWTDLTLTYYKSRKYSFGGDAGIRGLFSHKNWTMIYMRPAVHYRFSTLFKLSGGVGFFNTFNKNLLNAFELRLFQDFQFAWPNLGWINFDHRIRFEERFFFYDKIDNSYVSRGRYLIGLKTRDFKLIGGRKNYYFRGMWEGFVPLGDSAVERFVNNQRWYAALGYRASDRWHFELHYIWQKSRLLVDDGFKTQESVLRLRAFYTLKVPAPD